MTAKDTIDKPEETKNDWPLEQPDERVLAFDLKRDGVDNQQQIEASPIATACLRCNTSMQFCGDREGAKARGMYICSYSWVLHVLTAYRSTQKNTLFSDTVRASLNFAATHIFFLHPKNA